MKMCPIAKIAHVKSLIGPNFKYIHKFFLSKTLKFRQSGDIFVKSGHTDWQVK